LVMFSPDGQTLACFGSSDTIQLWSVVDPAQPRLLSQALNGGSNDGFSSLAFSSGGRILATGDGNGVVQLWNIPQTVLAGSGTGGIGSLAFSPDGRILASVDYDGSAQLWDVANPAASAPLGSLPVAMNRQITSLTFSPDSRILAGLLMSGQTGTVQLWNIATRHILNRSAIP